MGFIGPELIILIVLLIFLIRPKLITDFAKGLGRMFREAAGGGSGERRQKLVEVAKQLGIDPRGKSEEQLLEEIKRKLSA